MVAFAMCATFVCRASTAQDRICEQKAQQAARLGAKWFNKHVMAAWLTGIVFLYPTILKPTRLPGSLHLCRQDFAPISF